MSQQLTPGAYVAEPAIDPPQSCPFTVDAEGVLTWRDGQQYKWSEEEGRYVSVLAPLSTLEFHAAPLVYLKMGSPIEVGTWRPV